MKSPDTDRHRASVIGGSTAGPFAASLLRRAGWNVDLNERSDAEPSGRGAGIVTHDESLQALTDAGASLTDLGVAISERVAEIALAAKDTLRDENAAERWENWESASGEPKIRSVA